MFGTHQGPVFTGVRFNRDARRNQAPLTQLAACHINMRRSNCIHQAAFGPQWLQNMNHYLRNSLLLQALCIWILFNSLLPPSMAQTLPARISIVVVEGEGATSHTQQRVTQDPVVRVEDDDHQPIAGAAVVFALPVSGTSGEFANGTKTLTLVTDKNGLAAAHGIKTNDVPGKLQIYVTASFHTLRTRALVNQNVEAAPGAKTRTPDLQTSKSGGKWKWVLLGIVAAGGAGAGVYFGTHNGSASPVSISAGSVAFGSPH